MIAFVLIGPDDVNRPNDSNLSHQSNSQIPVSSSPIRSALKSSSSALHRASGSNDVQDGEIVVELISPKVHWHQDIKESQEKAVNNLSLGYTGEMQEEQLSVKILHTALAQTNPANGTGTFACSDPEAFGANVGVLPIDSAEALPNKINLEPSLAASADKMLEPSFIPSSNSDGANGRDLANIVTILPKRRQVRRVFFGMF